VVVAALAGGLAVWWVVEVMGWPSNPPALEAVARTQQLPVLSVSEAALIRARTLYARGRLADALLALDQVDLGSPVQPSADALRVEIQQTLLAARRGVSPATISLGTARP
jgi:hypothetical protein